jgi:xylono-1,5-lactonase
MQQLAGGYGLIKGPVWDAAKGLYCSDGLGGGVYLLDRQDKVSLAAPKRRGIGGMALPADGGLIAGGRDIVHLSLLDHSMEGLCTAKTADKRPDNRRQGSRLLGSLAFAIFKGEAMMPGNLYIIDVDGSVRRISDAILVTNGHFLPRRPAAVSLRRRSRTRLRLRRA